MELKQIREIVESHTKIDIGDKSRIQKFVYTRAMYFALCREYTLFGLAEIGKSIGKNHATVLHGVKLFNDWISEHEDFYIKQYEKIEHEIQVKFKVRGGKLKTRGYYKRKYAKILNEHRTLIHKHQNLKKLLNI
ncbi:MAG: putative bacterial DnaA helix-turn-helix protein [Prokaryotic dsDNA virus sp.]|nr:MAG: putative bacterial DnaA helix-turn-helix protein [Prokaryotic dsDNA virus sp.]|tara:strand:- start:1696 stop:2097 length:402 start_codon:yes stop_codon:yes gene_type:complete